jgi:penicillin-binding protein 1C
MLIVLFVIFFLILFFSPKPELLDGVSFSRAVYDNKHRLLRLTLSKDDRYRLYTPLSKLSPQLIEATLLQEDQYFRYHCGVNPISLFKALWHTYVVRTRRIGASTITMQLARMHFGIYSKKPVGKLWQIFKALQIELHYTKNEILEAYFNLAPYGGNIEGVGAASLIYFGHTAHSLTLPEALTLGIIPQHPAKRMVNQHNLVHVRQLLFSRWLQQHPEDIDKKMLFDLPLVMQSPKSLPFKAPHLVNQILMDPLIKSYSINSTIDSDMQRVVERVTKYYLARKSMNGVHNAAVMLVDTRDMGVKALLGSADFFNKSISGQINGVEIKRSPGSTLKPFIYALALDQGLIHPATVLKDVPHSFNGYNPENFDYDFIGPVSASMALVLSRNIPAIYLSHLLSHPTLYQLLEKAAVSQLRPESYYGLSLNLGGVELSMKELIGLYAMLVNEGVWKPLVFTTTYKTHHRGRRLLSPESTFLVLDMLKQTPLADLRDKSGRQLDVSWKTGTSSGFRDAWTIGTFGPYVVAVWLGNFNNQSNAALIGKEIALPLFFELIEGIIHEIGRVPNITPNPIHMNLKKVQVCRESGMLPTQFCTDTEWTWFIPGKSPIKTDTIFREVAINSQTGLRTCHINENTRFEIFEFWPSDLLAIFKKAGIHRHIPPFFESDCALSDNNGISPKITSPQAGVNYVINAQSHLENTIPLIAVTDAGIESLYWFINETFIAKTKADEAYLWHPKPGTFVIRAVDEHGLSAARDVHVELK